MVTSRRLLFRLMDNRRLASADFLTFGQQISNLVRPQRRDGFAPLIDSLAGNAQHFGKLAGRSIKFLECV